MLYGVLFDIEHHFFTCTFAGGISDKVVKVIGLACGGTGIFSVVRPTYIFGVEGDGNHYPALFFTYKEVINILLPIAAGIAPEIVGLVPLMQSNVIHPVYTTLNKRYYGINIL